MDDMARALAAIMHQRHLRKARNLNLFGSTAHLRDQYNYGPEIAGHPERDFKANEEAADLQMMLNRLRAGVDDKVSDETLASYDKQARISRWMPPQQQATYAHGQGAYRVNEMIAQAAKLAWEQKLRKLLVDMHRGEPLNRSMFGY